jgi:hypothetical protein
MNTSLQLHKTNNWRQFFFDDPLPFDLPEVLPGFLKQRSQDFIEIVPYSFTDKQTQELNAWYWSSDGQDVLHKACDALWKQMSIHAQNAQPAHDARHAMYKVPSAALAYIQAEQVGGWERVGVLGALLHDYGRWPEERIYGEPLQSQLHAQISFVLGQEWLEPFDMPLPVKQHILLSALRHTSGADVSDPMPLKITVSADRDQLYGPEFVLRIVHHIEKKNGDFGSFYGENKATSVLDKIHHMALHRLPGPLFSRSEYVDALWRQTVQFLLLAYGHDAQWTDSFISALKAHPQHIPMLYTSTNLSNWLETARTFASSHAYTQRTLANEIDILLSATNIAPGEDYRQYVFKKMHYSPEAEKHKSMAAALAWTTQSRLALDAAEAKELQLMAGVFADDLLLTNLLGKWDVGVAVICKSRKSMA